MTDKPNSTELINMAHREWKNRQERKGHDDEVAWTSGWISGYLTGRGSKSCDFCKPCDHCDFNERDMQMAEAIMKAKKAEREKVLDNLREWFIKNKCNGCPYGRNLLDKIKSLRGGQ